MSKPMMRVVQERPVDKYTGIVWMADDSGSCQEVRGDAGIWFRTDWDPKCEGGSPGYLSGQIHRLVEGRYHEGLSREYVLESARTYAIRLAALLSRETESEEPCPRCGEPAYGTACDGASIMELGRCRLRRGHSGPCLPERRREQRRNYTPERITDRRSGNDRRQS